jgi:hypothetical protein
MLGALVLLVASAEPRPEWTSTRAFLDAPAFVLPAGQVLIGVGAWTPTGAVVVAQPRLAVGLPQRLEADLAAELYATAPGLNLVTGTRLSASLTWAPTPWDTWPLNPTVGLGLMSTPELELGVGPTVGVAGTLVSPRWHLAADAGALALSRAFVVSPFATVYLDSSWVAQARAHTAIDLGALLTAALTARWLRAGPTQLSDRRTYATSHAEAELALSLQLHTEPFQLELGAGVLDYEFPDETGHTMDRAFPFIRAALVFTWPRAPAP